MAASSKRQTWWAELVVRQSMCQPAVRTVVVEAIKCTADDPPSGEIVVRFTPAVAILSRVVNRYWIESDHFRQPGSSDKEMRELGWRFDGKEENISAVIVCSDFGLMRHDDPLIECWNSVSALAACPWPQEEDEKRLADLIDSLKEQAKSLKPSHA